MKTAVFLGAGASRAFGYPLTKDLLPRILSAIDRDELFSGINTDAQNTEDRLWFKEGLHRFFPGVADARKTASAGADLGVGVTDLLTLVDRALQWGESRAGMSPEDMVRFRHLLERALYEVLLQSNDCREKTSSATLERFIGWLRAGDTPANLITTNYDTAVDQCIYEQLCHSEARRLDSSLWEQSIGAEVDLGFPWRQAETGELMPRPARHRWQILKLHGSVNWLRCSLCGQIYMNPIGAVAALSFQRKLTKWNTCHCNDWARLRLHLVTPSFVRQSHDAHLLGIWQAALETLRTADQWVLIGYSLPPDDIAIRALILRAWESHASPAKPKVTVVQYHPDQPDHPTRAVYRAFFPAANLDYRDDGLDAFLAGKNPAAPSPPPNPP